MLEILLNEQTLHKNESSIIQAQITGKETVYGLRASVTYTQLAYLIDGKWFETKLYSAMNEHVGEEIVIGIKSNSKPVRVNPIIPQLGVNYLIWALNIFLLVNYCKVRKQHIRMRREKLKEWETE